MAYIAPQIIEAIGKVHDVMAELFFAPGTIVKMLKISETSNAFDELQTISDSWFLRYSKNRQQYVLQIAKDVSYLTSDAQSATHIQIDDDIYVISTADTVPPKGTDVTWKFYCEKFTTRAQFKSLY